MKRALASAASALVQSLAVALVAASCSGASVTQPSETDDSGATVRSCVPGQELACVCPSSGKIGTQICSVSGATYGTCVCAAATPDATVGDEGGTRRHPDGGTDGSLQHDGSLGDDGGSSHEAGEGGEGDDGGPGGTPCPFTASDPVDHDGDGWSGAQGDCNDCNKFINPGAYDIPGNHIDEDCSGKKDDEPTGCDGTIGLTSPATTDATEAAKAMDLCRTADPNATLPKQTWGVIATDYLLPDQTESTSPNFALGFGLLGPTYGTENETRQGQRMLGLSTGTARQPSDSDYQSVQGFDKGYTSGTPAGFPDEVTKCGAITYGQAHDGAAFRVTIRIPTNALTMSFDSNFFAYDFPEYVCSVYNDDFVVVVSPDPQGESAAANHNVTFDPLGNSLTVNGAFLRVCDATNSAGSDGSGPSAGDYSYACGEGSAKLVGTGYGADSPGTTGFPSPSTDGGATGDGGTPDGAIPDGGSGFFDAFSFDTTPPTTDTGTGPADTGTGTTPGENHASTDWVTTTIPVASLAGQRVTFLFAVWDSADGIFDSTVLVDNVRWTFATAPDTVAPTNTAPVTVPAD